MVPLLLLFLALRPSSAETITNCSSTLRFSNPASLYLDWRLPSAQKHSSCMLTLTLAYAANLEVSYYSGNGVIYNPTPPCYNSNSRVSSEWTCDSGCRGLFYSKSLHTPELVRSMQQALSVRTSVLRLFYCHDTIGLYTEVHFVIHSDERGTDDYQDPVWRVLGPVLATVCMVATVFLVCVCYVQHAYHRGQPRCCRWINDRLRGPLPPEAEGRSGPGEGGHLSSAHRHIDPLTDLPPAYDDFRKYHRPCSFGEADRARQHPPPPHPHPPPPPPPPSYTEAVQSLEQEELQQRARARARSSVRRSLSCGAAAAAAAAAGVDNPAFQREDAAPPPPPFSAASHAPVREAASSDDLTIEMDLGEGQAGVPQGSSNC